MDRKFNFHILATVVIFASASVVFIALCFISKTLSTKTPVVTHGYRGAERKEGIQDNDSSQSSSSSRAEDNPRIYTILVNKAHPGNCPTRTHPGNDGGPHLFRECGATCDPSNHLSASIFSDNVATVLQSNNNSCLQIQKTPMASNGCKFATTIAICGNGEGHHFWVEAEDSRPIGMLRTAFGNDCKPGARLALRQTSEDNGMAAITVEPEEDFNREFLWTQISCQNY